MSDTSEVSNNFSSNNSSDSRESKFELHLGINDEENDEEWCNDFQVPEEISFEDNKKRLADCVLECKYPIDFFELLNNLLVFTLNFFFALRIYFGLLLNLNFCFSIL